MCPLLRREGAYNWAYPAGTRGLRGGLEQQLQQDHQQIRADGYRAGNHIRANSRFYQIRANYRFF